MMKRVFLFLSMIAILAQSVSAEPPRLISKNGDFLTRDGDVVVLRGVNWAEPWTCSMQDMEKMRELGINVVRLWCHEKDVLREFDSQSGKPSFRIAQVAEWARVNDVYLIIVLGDMVDGPVNEKRPWENTALRERVRKFWELVAKATWSNPAVLGYEIMNEPRTTVFDQEDYVQFVSDIATSIRFFASNTTVVVPGPTEAIFWEESQDFKVDIPNVAYSYSFWDPYFFTHAYPHPASWPTGIFNKSWLEGKMNYLSSASSALDAPVVLSEFGATFYATGDSELRWVRQVTSIMEKKHLHGMFWSYKSYRAKSFHLYYNRIDRKIPLQLEQWTEMMNVLKPWWVLNEFPKSPVIHKKNTLLRVN